MRFRVYLIIIAVIVVLGGAVYGLNAAPFLRIAGISVSGNKLVSADEVKEALIGTLAAKPNVWSLLGDDHVLFWLAKQGAENLNEPLIASSSVTVNTEERIVQVSVTERQLAGIVCTASTTGCYAFDKNGIVFAQAPVAEGQLYFVIQSNASTTIGLGKPVFGADEIQRFDEVYNALLANNVPVKAFRLRDEALEEWEADLENGTVLYFDRLFVPDDLSNVIAALVKRPDFNALSYVDFRVPNRIYFQ